ncbi:hypothetical protein BD289DRAFT_488925 [Coniella lustricola]|uniref:Uncharacterized protein n=1 Tax=Coniella lustricola TaxID=2025994 RepID=A0A2T3AJ59_9PEZI|nr:hypothetical protein BD289DRAFT_488925 [Coniella lustricola]
MSYEPNHLYDPSWLLWTYPPPEGGHDYRASQGFGNGTRDNSESQSSSSAVTLTATIFIFPPREVLTQQQQDVRNICTQSQSRVKALSDAISLQPEISPVVIELLNNDLRIIAQQLVAITQHCNTLEGNLHERTPTNSQTFPGSQAELNDLINKLQTSENQIRSLQKQTHEMEQTIARAEQRRKDENEKKNLKKKSIKDLQAAKAGKGHSPPSEDELPTPAMPENEGRQSPHPVKPKHTSTLNGKDEAFLIENLKKMNLEHEASAAKLRALQNGSTSFENIQHANTGGPMPNPYGHFGVAPVVSMVAMSNAVAPYGPFVHTGPYGHMPNYPGHAQPFGPMPADAAYYNHHGPSRHAGSGSTHDAAKAAAHRADIAYLNAVVLHRDETPGGAIDVQIWREMLNRHYTAVLGWTEKYCKNFVPGSAAEAIKTNPRLWAFMLKVSTNPRDPEAAPSNAMFMIESPTYRVHFIARMILQYFQGEMLHWKFWLGWTNATDERIERLGAVIDTPSSHLEQRCAARRELRKIVEMIVKDKEWCRYRGFKNVQNADRLGGIAGTFLDPNADPDGYVGVQSLCNVVTEISHKIMTSRLSFGFTWSEVGVKFCRDQHIAINTDESAQSLEQRHARLALAVTPSVTVVDDNSSSLVPSQVLKSQVYILK